MDKKYKVQAVLVCRGISEPYLGYVIQMKKFGIWWRINDQLIVDKGNAERMCKVLNDTYEVGRTPKIGIDI